MLAFLPLFLSCKGSIDLGQGADADARLTTDVYTWECGDASTGEIYEGAFSWNVSLEYAPDGLQDRQLPSGCVYGLSMFPFDAGTQGADIPGLTDEPEWFAGDRQGELRREGAGFYFDEVFSNVRTCEKADELLESGLTLEGAGSFSGAATPTAGSIGDVSISGTAKEGVIEFGETVQVDWDAEDWDDVWIQVRQERDGEAWGTVTCNAGDGDSFTVDEDVWDLLTELPVEYIDLYVGFQNTEIQELEDGQKIELVTRGMHVFVVQD
jgi:hypothetical protein